MYLTISKVNINIYTVTCLKPPSYSVYYARILSLTLDTTFLVIVNANVTLTSDKEQRVKMVSENLLFKSSWNNKQQNDIVFLVLCARYPFAFTSRSLGLSEVLCS